MARGRIRKTDKGSFDENNMREAVKKVLKNKLSIRKAAAFHNVKFQTLARYVKKQVCSPDQEIRMRPNYECRRIFTTEQEVALKKYIITCSQMCYGQSTVDVRRLAYEMASVNNITVPDSWVQNSAAGLEWLHGFFNRHPDLSVRQPESCSLSRMTSFNRHNVSKFYDNLKLVLERNPTAYADGSRIYNIDETATTTVQKQKKIVATKGVKQVSKATSQERGVLVTTCCIVNAAGNTICPAMVFPRKNFQARMIRGAPPGTLGLVSFNGWMTAELFVHVMQHFIKHSGSTIENPTLLIFDNHESHLSINVLNLAKENGVNLLTLPPHSSHRLQPLDISIFAPFKSYYNSAIDSWMLRNPAVPITIYEIAEFVGIAHDKAMTPSNIKSGFKKAGIYPFDRDLFTDTDFLSSSVTDRPIESNGPNPLETMAIDELQNQTQVQGGSRITERSLTPEVAPSTSTFISPEMFKGYPKAKPRKTNRKPREKGRSLIATDTPEKIMLEEKALERERKRESVKRKVYIEQDEMESDSGEDDNMSVHDESSDYDGNEDINTFLEDNKWDSEKPPEVDSFVLVQFKTHQKRDIKCFYIGKIVEEKNESDEYDVNFLRKSGKFKNRFIFPIVEDRSLVHINDIKIILPPPRMQGTKRQQSALDFGIDFCNMDVR